MPASRFRLLNLLFAAALAVLAVPSAVAQRDADGNPIETQALDRAPTREERLRQHEQRVARIIEERRKARLAEQQGKDPGLNLSDEDKEYAGIPLDGSEPEEPIDEGSLPFGTMILYVNYLTNDEAEAEQLDAVVRQHDRFISEVKLRNEASAPFDRIRIALKFDKRFIKPVRVFDSEVRPFAMEPPVFSINQRDSVLLYDVTFEKPRYSKNLPVLRILWEANVPTEYTKLDYRFASGDTETGEHTAVYYQGRNVLGDQRDPLDGALSGSLLILKPFNPNDESQADILQGKKEELLVRYLSGVGQTAPAGMRLIGPERAPAVGDEFQVSLRLENPGGAVIDALSFFVTFDPNVLQVVDDDRANWIKRGINVHDGKYRLDYPFDFHKRNEVDNVRGYINYSMSLGQALTLPSGTFAHIKFRAVGETASTSVDLIETREGAGNLTSLRTFGYELFSSDPELTTPTCEIAVILPTYEDSPELASADDAAHERVRAVPPPSFLFDPRLVN